MFGIVPHGGASDSHAVLWPTGLPAKSSGLWSLHTQNVCYYEYATSQCALTTLKAVVGEVPLHDLLTQRER